MGEFHEHKDGPKSVKSVEYYSHWQRKVALIEEVLYDEDSKSYFDLNLETGQRNKNYFASNYVPLYFYTKSQFPSHIDAEQRKADLLSSLKEQKVLDYPYGIPNSLGETGQQWDFPNSWPPSVHMIIAGLLNCGGQAMEEGKIQAAKWLNVNYNAYKGKTMTHMNVSVIR